MRLQKLTALALPMLALLACLGSGASFAGTSVFPSVFGTPPSTSLNSSGVGVAGTTGIITIALSPNGQTTTGGRLLSIGFAGANASDFAIVPGGTCVPGTTFLVPTTSSTGTSCTVNVRYTPSTPTTENATLQVTCQAQGIIGGFSLLCTAAGATGAVAALVGAISAISASIPVPALGPGMTTALALLMLAMGMVVAVRRPPR